MQLTPLFVPGRWYIQINTSAGDMVSESFSRIKKLLGRNETRTRDRKCFQAIRTVIYTVYLVRRSSKNCDLQFANSDRFKENYSIDYYT